MKKKLLSYLFTIPTALASCSIVVSCNKTVPFPKEFAFDSWQTIAHVAKGGLQALKDAYHPLHDTFIIQDLNNSVEKEAKTRQLFIEGVGNFEVRVVGENQDVDEKGNPIPLTFEFKSLVNAVRYSPADKKSNCYQTSNLRTFLNNKFLEWAGSDFANYLVPAKKTTCIGEGSNKTEQSMDKIFPLSVSEIGISTPDGSIPLDEGNLYKFYELHKNDKDRDIYDRNKTNYWLRSPMAGTQYNAWIIRDDTPSTLDFDDISDVFCVCPAFCI